MSAEAWSALIAAIGVVITIIFQIRTWQQTNFARKIDLIANFDNRFETQEFREIRRNASTYLLDPDDGGAEGREAVCAVINFFETLGYLYSKGTIDKESVWHFFSSWLIPYYVASETVRFEKSENDSNVYIEFKKLYDVVTKEEIKRHPSNGLNHITDEDAIKEFLTSEAKLHMKEMRPLILKP